ncbi:MAG TPA: hypothetical protein VKA84_27940 [Gemmatimonadaceae bacterium]|nr:hypothetical protein [Gemmatimonadaceae bacterium]
MPFLRRAGPRGYLWSFVALEYYTLVLNRTYKIFVTDQLLCGAIVRGWLAAPIFPGGEWYDPEFYARERLLRRYEGVDVSAEAFLAPNLWNFQLPRAALADVEFDARPKWGMGTVPYSGRIRLHFHGGGSRELILLGLQDGPGIRDRLRPALVAARLPWWRRWLPAPVGTPAPGSVARPAAG